MSLRTGSRSGELVDATEPSSAATTDEDLVPPNFLLMERVSQGPTGLAQIVNAFASRL